MEDGDAKKYHVSSVIQEFVFSSPKKGCIRCISWQVYNKKGLPLWKKYKVANKVSHLIISFQPIL